MASFLVLVALAVVCALYRWRGRCRRRHRELATSAAFAGQLLEQEEIERKRVAQATHDGLGHQLLELKNAAAQARGHPATDAALREQLENISSLASQSLEQARGIAYRLRPFELDHLGLKAALEALLVDVFRGTDLRVFKNLEALPEPLTATQKLHAFRLVQEGFNNVIRHAHACTVLLEITCEEETMRIQLEDDGVGFDLGTVEGRRSGGLGLPCMETRVKLMGGRFEISSAPGAGTRIRVTIPLPPASR